MWTVQPDLVIETGIAHGGSIIFSASMLELNAACEEIPMRMYSALISISVNITSRRS
jgi:cephalosporin hydroxylase